MRTERFDGLTGERFDSTSAATWIARGRAPEHAELLAAAWRDFPDLPFDAPLEERMARTRERTVAMRPIHEEIQRAARAEHEARNFAFYEGKAAAGDIRDHELAILTGHERFGYDWDRSICYSKGWYDAHVGNPYNGPGSDRPKPEDRAAYDQGFADGGGDAADLFDAARRTFAAAVRLGNHPAPEPGIADPRPLPSKWQRPTDAPRPVRWSRRLIILADDPEFDGSSMVELVASIRSRPGAEALNIVTLDAVRGFGQPAGVADPAVPLTPDRCADLAADQSQTARLRALIAGMDIDEIFVAAQGSALAVIDAHSAALPLCRTMERACNTLLQRRAHLKLWLDRAAPDEGNAGAGHIRWSKMAQGLSGKLGEFTVRYAGKTSEGHILLVEIGRGTPAEGFVTADGSALDPRIRFRSKAKMRQEMAAALRMFGGATALAMAWDA